MVSEIQKGLITTLAIFLALIPLSAQNKSGQTDSLVRLMSAKSIEQLEVGGQLTRKTIDPIFLHNGTYLICDTALWNLGTNIINCYGHVKLEQGDSELTSEKLDYYIDDDLASFRGPLVQLRNEENNILRTRYLDYNTRDSVAFFRNGAAMKSKDGQFIESDEGYYWNGKSLFNFKGNVNMYSDTVFVKTSSLNYESDVDRAVFTAPVDFWKDDNMLSARSGWYDRKAEVFFFNNDVHALSPTQETWSDSLYFHRNTNDVLLLGNAQVQDSTRRVAALSDYMHYEDSLSRVTLKQNAAVAMWEEREERMDTTYVGADLLVYYTRMRSEIEDKLVEQAQTRLETMLEDPVAAYRRRAAEQAVESLAREKDSSGPVQLQDSLSLQRDSLVLDTPKDTTKIGFAFALGDIRVFRSDMQVRCDSLLFSDLDSLARLYKKPVVWNEGTRQYSADSLFVLIRGNKADRASLMSNAFITVQEDSTHFDQIKSPDVMAYFNDDSSLRRFDALGGASALFYLQENETVATVNKVECKMFSAMLKDGSLDNIVYFDSPKNDAYPVVQMPEKDQRMKGFDWQPDRRPKGREDVTGLELKPSQRKYFEDRPKAVFDQTDRYFPGMMSDVYKSLSEARLSKSERQQEQRQEASADTSATVAVAAVDTLAVPVVDSLALSPKDTLAAVTEKPEQSSGKDEEYMSDRELKRALRTAARDARWARLDERDAAKAAARKEKKDAALRKKEAKAEARRLEQDEKDRAKLEKYIERYQKQKDRNERRKEESDSSGERAQGA